MSNTPDILEYALVVRMISSNPTVTDRQAPCTMVLTDDSDTAASLASNAAELSQRAADAGLGPVLVLPERCTLDGAAAWLQEKIHANRVVPSIVAFPGRALFLQGISSPQPQTMRRALIEGVPLSPLKSRGTRLQGCIALVTGSAQGFGRGIAEIMAQEGASIVVADLNTELGEQFAELLNHRHGEGTAIFSAMNVTDATTIETAITACVRHFGGLDMLVANAGVLKAGSLEEMDERSFTLVTDVNYKGYFICTKAASRWMKRQHALNPNHFMDIVQINSKSGLEGSRNNFAYAGSKFGTIGLTQSFALELVSDHIKVNSICPGNYFDGPLWSDPENGLFVQYLHTGKVPGAKTIEDVRNFYLSKVPMQRGCTPRDVTQAIMYVHDQTYETGQAIPVTGGQVMLK